MDVMLRLKLIVLASFPVTCQFQEVEGKESLIDNKGAERGGANGGGANGGGDAFKGDSYSHTLSYSHTHTHTEKIQHILCIDI